MINVSLTAGTIVLQAHGLSRYFVDGQRQIQVLNGVDLTIHAAEMVAIVGASGSGKSTLLHCLGLLDRPDAGQLSIAGKPTETLNEKARSRLRNESLGFVYQFHHLLPEFNATDNVAMPLIVGKEPLASARKTARHLLEAMGLGHRLENYPGQLSGGERQRVALARALVTRPVCVLADEPTGNLDRETAGQVFELIARIRDDFGTAVVLVTHDLSLAERADRCLSMVNGRLFEGGVTSDAGIV
ncbi:ABC transporter ATP-binding protein [Orrella daihaiensis]|uniref:ABC transporter ATP-binding protein n=1 Tax=Orrella daihaiensis TaxID=2782176 RepID=A0ABY4AG77_9BURK|nr:ABC transporter ATP-binding protein [Orrella daihaiensis]UOD49288.1 ABC transporter ATP-binding protein [Orrella daihaiensis]